MTVLLGLGLLSASAEGWFQTLYFKAGIMEGILTWFSLVYFGVPDLEAAIHGPLEYRVSGAGGRRGGSHDSGDAVTTWMSRDARQRNAQSSHRLLWTRADWLHTRSRG